MKRLRDFVSGFLTGNSSTHSYNIKAADQSTSHTNVAIAEVNGPVYFGTPPSEPSTLPSMSTPQPDVYHGLLIYHSSDSQKACELQCKLNKIKLANGQPVRIALEEDLELGGQLKTEAFKGYLRKTIFVFLFITKPFVDYNIDKWKSEVPLVLSLQKRVGERFVIPIITDADVLDDGDFLKLLVGINYHNYSWTSAEKSFRKNLEEAERRRLLMINGSSVDLPPKR